MSDNIGLVAERTAVLCMDYQASIVSAYAGDTQDDVLTRVNTVLDHARKKGMRVVYVRVGFRPGLPEVSDRNALFSALKNSPEWQKRFFGDNGEIHEAIAPIDGDVVVVKHRVSAFTGTDLDMILRANEIDTLVLFGIATSGVVLSTLVDAADRDYRLFVLGDCCADTDTELHSCLVERYFTKRGTVISASDFVGSV